MRSFGVADKATGAPMTPDLYMRIGSETKTFTVTALLQLVDQGKVGLDDPIGKYVTACPTGPHHPARTGRHAQRAVQLHRGRGLRQGADDRPGTAFTPQQLLDYSFKHPVLFQPGEKFDYCNTNLILLGLVVEKVSRPAARRLHPARTSWSRPGWTHTPSRPAPPSRPARAGLHGPDRLGQGRGLDRLEPVLGLGGRSDDLRPPGPAQLGAYPGHRQLPDGDDDSPPPRSSG